MASAVRWRSDRSASRPKIKIPEPSLWSWWRRKVASLALPALRAIALTGTTTRFASPPSQRRELIDKPSFNASDCGRQLMYSCRMSKCSTPGEPRGVCVWHPEKRVSERLSE
ncbi:hypothetical protein F5Y14DRAFT_452930 [Nemania sp. NC0429]|nr:hypothetical protein F5Y14DRAFT_452930 [Nemania sp. NC0429]